MFKKILIANRGEIAVRVIRACREMGIRTVAVYSECDRRSLHVLLADEAVPIGPAPAVESYLHMDRIIEAARTTGAEAVHPGYGFLAENSGFARACGEAGLVFIGPNADALELVGDKVRARRTMKKAGVPIIPGMSAVPSDKTEFTAAARKLGYPVIVKASAGGGGKGMRIVHEEKDLLPAVEAGMREAGSAFGTPPSISRNTSPSRVTWSSRSWPTTTAALSTCSSASARSRGAIRRSSRSRPRRP